MDIIKNLCDAIIKLIDVATIITFTAMFLWIYMTLNGIENDFAYEMIKMIVYFYFGTKVGKSIAKAETNDFESAE